MADVVKVLLVSNIILLQKTVQAYYCDNDLCKFDEYCCGNNECCTSYNVWQMWYFWCGLVLFLILLFACAGFWRYKYYSKKLAAAKSLAKNPYAKFTNSGATASVTMHVRTDSDLSTLSDVSDFRPHHLRNDSDLSVLSDDLAPEYTSHRTSTPGYSSHNYGHSGPPPYSQTVGGPSGHYSKTHRDRDALLETEY